MLDRTDFASWQQRIRLYCQGKKNEVNILKSIDEGPYQIGTVCEPLVKGTEGAPQLGPERPRVYSDLSPEEKDRYNADIRATNILLQGLPKDIYSLINHYINAKDIWDNVKMLLEGSELTKEDRESQLYDDFEHFRQHKGEIIHDYYVWFAKLINDMRNIKMTMSRMQLNSKFVNNMLPEWENKMMLECFSQHTMNPLALMSNVSNPQRYSPSSSTSSSTQVLQHLADNPHLDSSLSPTENLIKNLTNTLALLTQSYKTIIPQTNNQLQMSSNMMNQATVQDGRAMVRNVQGRQNRGQRLYPRGGGAAGYGGVQNRAGNANSGQARQAQENRLALGAKQLLFLAGVLDNAIDDDVDEQPVQELALNMDNVFQAEDCDVFNSDVDEAPTTQTMFMANLSSADRGADEAGPSCNSDNLSEVQDHDHYQDVVCTHNEEHMMQDNAKLTHDVDSHANHTSDSNMIPYDPYVKDNAVSVVHSNVSSVPNDAFMMTYNDMYEPHAQSVSNTSRSTVVENSLTAELATYKEQVELNNKDAHLDYLRHLKESVETIRDIVEEAKVVRPLDRSIVSACHYTKHSQELLEYAIVTCPQDSQQRDKQLAYIPLIRKKQVTFAKPSDKSQPKSNTKKNRISPDKGVRKLPVEDQPRTNKSHFRTSNRVDFSSRLKRIVINSNSGYVFQTCNKCLISSNHDMCVVNYLQSVVAPPSSRHNCNVVRKVKQVWKPKQVRQVWKPTGKILTTSGHQWRPRACSKHMTGDRSRLMNFVKKFIGIVRFENDHFGAIMGYGDYVIGNSVISRVYYVERPRHNLFFIGQVCDSDLEVAFRKHSYYVRDTDGVELIKGSRGSNLYTILVEDMMRSSLICLLSKAFKNKSWLWHRPCQLGNSKKHTHKSKTENINLEVLNTLHMDLCGSMRVQTINRKKYILVIVDDYSRFAWVKFLRSKDETPEVVIKFLQQIQVGLNKTVRCICTDNDTEFVNHTLTDYYERIDIFHQKTVLRTPQQDGVVERWNHTLIEAARTMLIFSKALMYLWEEAVATACYTQNRSLIHTRHTKTPYELVHNKKPDLTFFKVFGALCYPTNDSEDLGKL
nr:retrovirus-related Pol polyprotein from transposon TNT 1-94 [Tanacetum cinerariifolium]